MQDCDWAYIAGLFDGEGCLSCNRYGLYYRVTITQKPREVLDWLVETTGEGYIDGPNHKGVHRWRIFKAPVVRDFLEHVEPYCIVKREAVHAYLEL